MRCLAVPLATMAMQAIPCSALSLPIPARCSAQRLLKEHGEVHLSALGFGEATNEMASGFRVTLHIAWHGFSLTRLISLPFVKLSPLVLPCSLLLSAVSTVVTVAELLVSFRFVTVTDSVHSTIEEAH